MSFTTQSELDRWILGQLTQHWKSNRDKIYDASVSVAKSYRKVSESCNSLGRLETKFGAKSEDKTDLKSAISAVEKEMDLPRAQRSKPSDQLRKDQQTFTRMLGQIRKDETQIQEVKDEIKEARAQLRKDFKRWLKTTTLPLGREGGRYSLLPESNLAYARALSGYGGEWPPTTENLEELIKTENRSTIRLVEKKRVAQAKVAKSRDRNLIERSYYISNEPIDLHDLSSIKYLSAEDSKDRHFNTVLETEAKIRARSWSRARTARWFMERNRSEGRGYSVLPPWVDIDGDLSYLMRPPKAIQEQSWEELQSPRHGSLGTVVVPSRFILSCGWRNHPKAAQVGRRGSAGCGRQEVRQGECH